jgi:hypothetical protein
LVPQSQLYFLHIPKTAGSSLTRVLEDSWPAGAMAPQRFVEELMEVPDDERSRYEVIAGHHGLYPITDRSVVISVLREPAARAWSHYRAFGTLGGQFREQDVPAYDSFASFLEDPFQQWTGRDYQARWLAIPPTSGKTRPLGVPPGVRISRQDGSASAVDAADLEQGAQRTLRDCALVGTAERLDDFMHALSRLVGRRMPPPQRLNVGPESDGMPAEQAELVRARSALDLRLHAEADAALDRALTTLPALPAEPLVELPYEYDMSAPLDGTGWHARTHTAETGWHRWTGPGTRSDLRLPVRLAGPARLDVAIASACDDDAVRSLGVSVQGRPVAHRLEPRAAGVAAVADVELDRREPLTVALEIGRTKHLVDSASGARSADPAGLAVPTLSFSG